MAELGIKNLSACIPLNINIGYKQLEECNKRSVSSNFSLLTQYQYVELTPMLAEEEYKHYCSLHHKFSNIYADVNKQVMDLYPAPKKFLEETGPMIKQYVSNFAVGETNLEINRSFEMVFYFSNSFSDFAESIVNLFDDYKTLHDECTAYMNKIFILKQNDMKNEEKMRAYIRLTPEVTALVERLRQMGDKSRTMEKNFKQLEGEWNDIKIKIKA